MSAEFHSDIAAPAIHAPGTTEETAQRDLETARREAEDARRRAAAIGDYATAERWYNEERLIGVELRARDRQAGS